MFFDRIVVTPKMVTDHIPPNILKALKAASLPSESMTTTTTTTTTAAAP